MSPTRSADGNTSERRRPSSQSGDSSENTPTAAVLSENGAGVKFVSDGNVGTPGYNGPSVVPSTTMDVVVKTAKADKEKKAKKEKPNVVGFFELVS